jgi:hypothetical protein
VPSRRTFLRAAAAGFAGWPLKRGEQTASPTSARATAGRPPEILPNGIVLGSPWPPRYASPLQSLSPPYLAAPPAVIPIDVGRQLFVDDFLIAETNLQRTFHQPVYHPASPVLRPEREWEVRDEYAMRTRKDPNPAAMVFSDGVFFDPADRTFKMWYMGGYQMATCLAVSSDGVTWSRPSFDVVPGTNIVSTANRDSSTVWLDLAEPDPQRRFKMSLYNLGSLQLFVSADGIHWREAGRTGPTGDRSTFFYNPFRRKWIFSIRGNLYQGVQNGRYRLYWESSQFGDAKEWQGQPPVPWIRADVRDRFMNGIANEAEIYNLDCAAYESLLIGLFSVFRGEPADREKINEVEVGFSRDGFHWTRPDRTPFFPVSNRGGDWNYANVQSAGGCCVIAGDSLYFFLSGRQGRPKKAEPGVCTTGLAVLRRDGFASLGDGSSSGGSVTTRPVRFRGGHLFVNADATGEIRVEVLDRDGRVITGCSAAECVPIRGDSTKHAVKWKAQPTLGRLEGDAVRLRFVLQQSRLYSFWIADSPSGRSRGYVAGGGPGFASSTDV